jgi:hypothetical protein
VADGHGNDPADPDHAAGRLLLRPILRRLRKINAPGGWGIELSEDAAAETKADVEGAIKAYEPVLDFEFDRLAYAEGIKNRLETAVRRFLVRFGMFGRAWRLGRSLYADDVPDTEDALIEQSGMNRAQATTAAAGRRHSFVRVLLRHERVRRSASYLWMPCPIMRFCPLSSSGSSRTRARISSLPRSAAFGLPSPGRGRVSSF